MEGKLESECDSDRCCSRCAQDPECDQSGEHPGGRGSESGPFASNIACVPWKVRDVVIAAALFVPAGVIGSLALGIALERLSVVDDKILAAILGSILLPAALLAGAWFFGIRRHGASIGSLGFVPTSLQSATWLPAVALSIGLSVTAAYALSMEALGADILVPDQGLEKIAELEGVAQIPTFLIVGVLAPFGEEVFFRGFLLAALVPVMGGLRGALVSSGLFAVAHLNVGTLLPIFVMGMLLAWLYLRTGSIWPSIVAHTAQNLLALTFLEIPFDAPAAFLNT